MWLAHPLMQAIAVQHVRRKEQMFIWLADKTLYTASSIAYWIVGLRLSIASGGRSFGDKLQSTNINKASTYHSYMIGSIHY
jgi:hypothetical protein